MELAFDADDEAFRREVRAFLTEKLPAEFAERVRYGKTWTTTSNAISNSDAQPDVRTEHAPALAAD
jgi:hypothetical protein